MLVAGELYRALVKQEVLTSVREGPIHDIICFGLLNVLTIISGKSLTNLDDVSFPSADPPRITFGHMGLSGCCDK